MPALLSLSCSCDMCMPKCAVARVGAFARVHALRVCMRSAVYICVCMCMIYVYTRLPSVRLPQLCLQSFTTCLIQTTSSH